MRFWIILALAVSAFTGVQGYARGPRVVAWFTSTLLDGGDAGALSTQGYISFVFGLLLAAASVFVLTFVAIGLGDWMKARHALSGLARLETRQRDGEHTDRRSFLTAFGEADELVDLAANYSITLQAEDSAPNDGHRDADRYRAVVPAATYFRREILVDARLFVWFFRRLPAILCGLGVLGLAFGLLDGLEHLRTNATTAGWGEVSYGALAVGAQGGLIALFLALCFAVAIGFVHHAVVALRYQQTGEICRRIDGLFRLGGNAPDLNAVTRTIESEAGVLQRAVATLGSDLKTALGKENEKLVKAVANQGRAASEALSASIRAALARPMTLLTEAVNQATRDEGERVQQLLAAALERFVSELETRFGDQLGEVNELLKSSSAIATDVEKAFAGLADTLNRQITAQAETFSKELRAAIEVEHSQHAKENKQLAAQLKRFSSNLGRDVDKHSKQFDALVKKTLDRVEQITNAALATSGKDLAKTSAAFSGLQTVVESLALSVTPILNQVVDTQDRLLTVLDDDGAAGKVIAGAATEMNAAARASRETVEKFVVLASELSEAGRAFTGTADIARPKKRRTGGNAGRQTSAKSLGRALSDLREETEGASKELPEI